MPKTVLNDGLIEIITSHLEVAIPKLFNQAKGDPLAYSKISDIFNKCVFAEKCDETKLNLDEKTILDLRKLFHNPDEVSKYTKINHTEEHELFKKKMKKLVDKELEIAFRVQQQVAKANLPPPQAAKVEDFNSPQKAQPTISDEEFARNLQRQEERAIKLIRQREDSPNIPEIQASSVSFSIIDGIVYKNGLPVSQTSGPVSINNGFIYQNGQPIPGITLPNMIRIGNITSSAPKKIKESHSGGNHIKLNMNETYNLLSGTQDVTIKGKMGCTVVLGTNCQNIKIKLGMNSRTIFKECKDITIKFGMQSFAQIGDNCQDIHIKSGMNFNYTLGNNVKNLSVNGKQVC